MRRFSSGVLGVGALAACLAFGTDARANLTTTFVSVVSDGSGGFLWTYDVQLDAQQHLSGSTSTFGTIFDFGPLKGAGITVNGAALAANFTFSTSLLSTAASNTFPADDPNSLNINFVQSTAVT